MGNMTTGLVGDCQFESDLGDQKKMKYTQKNLDSLKGLNIIEARAKCMAHFGLDAHIYNENTILPAIARDVVYLWVSSDNHDLVISASAGDPSKLHEN